MTHGVLPGQSFPLGATVCEGGVNFCVFSRNATAVELLFFDDVDAGRPARRIVFDPKVNRTFYYWHVFVPGVEAGQLYGYRVHGPFRPEAGDRFDGMKLLVDPYARAVAVGRHYDREAAVRPGDNTARAMKSVVVDPSAYDWEGDQPLCRPYSRTVIYEMHVGGFTRHPSSGVDPARRGTYAGLVEKIPYLKDLGITAVELLPVQQFDEQDVAPPLRNYWGYNPVAFFAPHSGYSTDRSPLGPVNEFRDMVKALHAAGIEVILDVVFNHTAEGDHRGPTLSFRGFENRAYYHLEPDRRRYANYTGTGNTLNANHSVVRRLIGDCLRYWVAEMHVDGFRFDLASVLARDEDGRPLNNPPILWSIESDPVLAGTKIIAEAWDAAGLYQVGSFVGHRWAEWNGPYRDDVRRFFRGEEGMVGALAARLTGSPDLFDRDGRDPNRSINFVTCHDGFTLNDLVSYNEKHNEANGEENRDGTDANYSWNCGVEGPTDDPEVEALRLRQIKNFFTTLLISQGTPMLLMGDEVRRTQHGNNNAYCQDNALSWFDWRAVERQAGLLRFVRGLIRLNLTHEAFQQDRFWIDGGNSGTTRVVWHGVRLHEPDWAPHSHSLAFTLEDGDHLHVMLNAYWEPLVFELPPLQAPLRWHRLVDTGRAAPEDFHDPDEAPPVEGGTYAVGARAVVVLMAR
ncbi:glycogen debranching protein GlgX [Rhodocaloribacter litoris]|uniref:glycogen debranching protein GlgX n=1 Tax=Rhodocaloribacter litoris TaxID=2558931 RepID=UPI0014232536|nr:glycogen debranching protein GlgX [Rhodocaloribacter litoris]QXD14355.1 glycogen debranching protein GlgX [Rhodocaloribacter litoris]